MRPRPYLSFSQMTTFEQSPDRFVAQYVYGERQRTSRNMAYGGMLAEGLEGEEATGDAFLDLMASKLPKFAIMDKVVHDEETGVEVEYKDPKTGRVEMHKVPALTWEKEVIPVLARPDTARPDYTAFKEYKTSVRRWTQKMADESGQVTFYAAAIWLKCGFVPKDIELVNVQTAYEPDGRLQPTGEIWRFPTSRTMADVIRMCGRMKRAWAGIKELCEKEIL